MSTGNILHMNGGMGETSYANNSKFQRKGIDQVETILEENMILMVSNKNVKGCWKIADLGCSSGPNTLLVISNIMNIINKISLKLYNGITSHVFQIYLNDLFKNDFNTIFKLLPDFYQQVKEKKVGECFISATPGSFYGRLFPNNYIDFFHSSYSVHWLSQAPKDLVKNGEPLNKRNIYMSRTSPAIIYEAYFKQFEIDFKYFLMSRFEELTSDGMMVLTLVGRDTPNQLTSPVGLVGMVLNEMVEEGLVEEEKLNLFDFPVYQPTVDEVKQVIDAEGSFTLQTLKTFKTSWDLNLQQEIVDYIVDNKMRGEFIAKCNRAIYEPLLIAWFGENIMDELFSRFAKLVAQLIEIETLEVTNIVLFMTKDP